MSGEPLYRHDSCDENCCRSAICFVFVVDALLVSSGRTCICRCLKIYVRQCHVQQLSGTPAQAGRVFYLPLDGARSSNAVSLLIMLLQRLYIPLSCCWHIPVLQCYDVVGVPYTYSVFMFET